MVRVAGAHCSPLGAVPVSGAGADLLSVVEGGQQIMNDFLGTLLTKLTSQPRNPGRFFGHGSYATALRDTIVCLWLICAAVGSSLQHK